MGSSETGYFGLTNDSQGNGPDITELLPTSGGKIYGEGKIIRGKHYILEWVIMIRNFRTVYLWERGRIPGSILGVEHSDARKIF